MFLEAGHAVLSEKKLGCSFGDEFTPKPTSRGYGEDRRSTVCCPYPWAVFQCYLAMSRSITYICPLSQHTQGTLHAFIVLLLKSAWEAVTQPSRDCRRFELGKPTSNYFLKTAGGAHRSLVQPRGWSEGTSPEERGCKPPTPHGTRGLLGALSNVGKAIIVGFQFYNQKLYFLENYLYLKA